MKKKLGYYNYTEQHSANTVVWRVR